MQIGRDAWKESLHTYHNPAIPDPIFLFDRTKHLGFFIELQTWQVVMNLLNTPTLVLDKEIFTYYHALGLHEISHYIICPYDVITNGKLLNAAMKHVSELTSPIIVNIFSDLLIDKKLHDKKPQVMEFELRNTLKMVNNVGNEIGDKQHSNFFKILTKCYEIMWNIDLDLENNEYEEITPIAKKISSIILTDFEDFTTWEKKVSKIAKLMKNIMEEEFPTITNFDKTKGAKNDNSDNTGNEKNQRNQSDENSEPNQIETNSKNKGQNQNIGMNENKKDQETENPMPPNITAGELTNSPGEPKVPQDVQISMGNPLEIKTRITKDTDNEQIEQSQLESDAEALAQEMNLSDFVRVNRIMKLVSHNDAIRFYYRGISKNMIDIKITKKKPSGTIPIGIDTWRIGEPLEELDILQSLLVSPKLIPNITTRKWTRKEGPGIEMELKLPDLMLVIDSSGSMNWDPYTNLRKNKSPYHLALIASFAALQFASKKGVKVAGVNFSDFFITEQWTNDYVKIEKLLLRYMGSGTSLPIDAIKDLCYRSERRSLIILITDFEIFNWEQAHQTMIDILAMGNKLVAFFIGGKSKNLENEKFSSLISMGAKFYVISQIDDLIGLVIKEVKDVYDV